MSHYFIRPGGNFDPRTFRTWTEALDAAETCVNDTGLSCDVFDPNTQRFTLVFAHVGYDPACSLCWLGFGHSQLRHEARLAEAAR